MTKKWVKRLIFPLAGVKMRKITKKLIKEVLDDVESRNIKFSEGKFLLLMLNNKELRDDWDEVGDYDTVFRERLFQAIAEDCSIKANEGRWPRYCDSRKVLKEFEKEFREKAPKKGYELSRGFKLS